MRLCPTLRSDMMRSRVASASSISCADTVMAARDDAVAVVILARRAVSSFGSILRKVALIVIIVILFWLSQGFFLSVSFAEEILLVLD